TYGTTESVVLNAETGDNTFTINSTASGTTVTINANDGNDSATLGAATADLDSLTGPVVFDGGTGGDSIVVQDTATPFSDAYTINSNSISRVVFGGLTFSTTE